MKKKSTTSDHARTPWLVASAFAIVILGVAALFMWGVGMFDAVKDDPRKDLLAASLVVVGALLSAVVALIGIVVKYSIDDRNSQIAAEAQQSNHIDVAIRAVGLLSESATPHQIGGSLLALVSLGELELAVSLLASLWPDEMVSSSVALVVLEKCLSGDSEDNAISAAVILDENADRIQMAGERSMWPIPDLGWRTDLPDNCRLPLILAACEWLATSLEKDPNHLYWAVTVLYEAFDDPLARQYSAACLAPLGVFPLHYAVGSATHWVSIKDILEKLPVANIIEDTAAIKYQDRIIAALAKQSELPMEEAEVKRVTND